MANWCLISHVAWVRFRLKINTCMRTVNNINIVFKDKVKYRQQLVKANLEIANLKVSMFNLLSSKNKISVLYNVEIY